MPLIQTAVSVTAFDQVLRPLLKKKTNGYFMQDGSKAPTTNYPTNVLSGEIEDRMISYGLYPTRSPNLNPCDVICVAT
jgi:hypothetical protein